MLLGLLPCVFLLALGAPAASATITISDAQVSETNGATTATFTVTRTTGLFFGGATVHFATADGSAQAPGDYARVAGDLQFGSALFGETQVQTVPVTVRGDALDEPAETFGLVLSGSAEIADADGTATIIDDDPLPQAGVSDAPPAAEGDYATFTVSLSGRAVSVDFTTADGGAIAGEDYSASSGTLAIPVGATTATIAVPLADDGADESDEQFALQIGSPGFATLGRATAGATIADNDEPAAFAPPPARAPDASGSATDPGAAVAEPAPATSAAPRLGLSSPRLRRPSIVLVTVSCPRGASGCKGRVTIFSRPNRRSKIKALRQERRLGQRNFTLRAGTTRTLTIPLAKPDRVLLMRTGRMLVRAFAVTSDGSGPGGVRRANGTLIARTTHS